MPDEKKGWRLHCMDCGERSHADVNTQTGEACPNCGSVDTHVVRFFREKPKKT